MPALVLPRGTGFFDEKSVVGLSFANGAHKVYFGKSASPIDRIGNNIGHLHTTSV